MANKKGQWIYCHGSFTVWQHRYAVSGVRTRVPAVTWCKGKKVTVATWCKDMRFTAVTWYKDKRVTAVIWCKDKIYCRLHGVRIRKLL